jgi:hypothetical protein
VTEGPTEFLWRLRQWKSRDHKLIDHLKDLRAAAAGGAPQAPKGGSDSKISSSASLHRHGELCQLELLSHTVEKSYTLPEDLALERIPDPQGPGLVGHKGCIAHLALVGGANSS